MSTCHGKCPTRSMMGKTPLLIKVLQLFLFADIICAAPNAGRRTVMTWASGNRPDGVAQLRNASWEGTFEGVQAFCGVTFKPDGSGLLVNQTWWDLCSGLRDVAAEKNLEFHLCIGGKVPDSAIVNPYPIIQEAIALARENNFVGISLDDEYDCAPRSTLKRLERWMTFIDVFAQEVHLFGLQLSAAVQAMYGVQDVPYRPHCGPNKTAADCSQACNRDPSMYPLEERVGQLMANSKIDQWLEMDTYYFTTGRFLGALDWYVQNVPVGKLGVGMMNRDDLTEDGLVARFYALDRVDWLNIFILPADDQFLPLLRRWKTRCAGCGVQSTLGCYDLTVTCVATDIVTIF